MNRPEFDQFSGSYEELLRDPIRDGFAGKGSDFFQTRKRALILQYFAERRLESRKLRYLDVGCGKGELAKSLRNDFAHVAGCDPSAGMLSFTREIETRLQTSSAVLPFDSGSFDFVTAVCVYHHVRPDQRANLTVELARVLRPGGAVAIIEHNPYNPATQLIVSRTPVDADAVLLTLPETRALFRQAGLGFDRARYFLYFPEPIYKRGGDILESWLRHLPIGGQYAAFATKD